MRGLLSFLSILMVMYSGSVRDYADSWDGPQSIPRSGPWADVTTHGARAFTTLQTTTATTTANSKSVTLANPIDFSDGDGIAIAGAGATNAQSTPSVPSVTSRAAAGSTPYQYECVGYDKNSALTAASRAGSTSTGLASYPAGGTRVTISSLSRDANGVVTVTTTAAHNFQFYSSGGGEGGTVVVILGAAPADLNGWFLLASASDSTFTYQEGIINQPETSTTAGTATVFGYNRVTCPALPSSGTTTLGYYIYGRTSGSMTLIGKTLPHDNVFNDYGPNYTPVAANIAPSYVPPLPPSRATNGILSTTIVGGGGTTSITLAAAAANSVSGVYAYHDSAPAIVAAAKTGTTVLIPPAGGKSYPISSPLVMPTSSTVLVGAPLVVNETISMAGSSHWTAYLYGSTAGEAFGNSTYVSLKGVAFPQFITNNVVLVEHLALRSVLNIGSWMNTFRDDQFDSRWAGPNTMAAFNAIDPLITGAFATHFDHISSVSSSSSGPPDIPMGNFWFRIGALGKFTGLNNFDGRGILFDARSSPGWPNGINNGTGQVDVSMDVGSIGEEWSTPLIMSWRGGQALYGRQRIDGASNSDSTAPLFANWGNTRDLHSSQGAVSGNLTLSGKIAIAGCPSILTGQPLQDITFQSGASPDCPLGQNFNLTGFRVGNTNGSLGINVSSGTSAVAPTAVELNQPLIFPTSGSVQYPNNFILWQQPIPAPRVALAAGGSLTIGTHYTYFVTPIGYNGFEGTQSATSSAVTPTSRNQTAIVSWPAVSGAARFNVYRNGALVGACFNITTLSCKDSGGGVTNQPVNVPGTGMPILNSNEIGSTLFTVYPAGRNGAYSRIVSAAKSTRTNAIPDASGSFCLVSLCPLDTLDTASNCSSSASPASCGSAPSGSVVIAAGSSSVVVHTTAVTADSQILVTFDSSLGPKLSLTCNTTPQVPYVTARIARKSFTISVANDLPRGPGCFSYLIVN